MKLLLFLLCTLCAHGQSRQVAITFDDLPRGGDNGSASEAAIRDLTIKLLAPLRSIPVTGFVNAGSGIAKDLGNKGLRNILTLWPEYGAELGNHTYSHPDLNRTPLDDYTAGIIRGEPAILEATGKKPTLFRHPFLHAGKEPETKRGLETFLRQRGYRVAPVTLDNSDYVFALVYVAALKKDAASAQKARNAYLDYMDSIFAFFEARSVEVVGREFPQILLLHVNQLNADAMPELLSMMRRRGYSFVSVDTALKDSAYQLADEYVGPGGFSWIHRWSKTKGMPPKGEPDEPTWIAAEFAELKR